jgi:hypothetical protein
LTFLPSRNQRENVKVDVVLKVIALACIAFEAGLSGFFSSAPIESTADCAQTVTLVSVFRERKRRCSNGVRAMVGNHAS